MSTDLYQDYSTHFARAYEKPDPAHALSYFSPSWTQWLPADKNAPILDLGCGWGHTLLALHAKGYKSLFGIDMNAGMIAKAKAAMPPEVSVECVDSTVDWLRARPNKFKVVTMNNVIEHIPNDSIIPLLKQIRESLLPDGYLWVSTPNMACIFGAYTRYVDLTHITGFTEFSLRQLFDLCGYARSELLRPVENANWSKWRPWRPFRGLGLATSLRKWTYRFLIKASGVTPVPTCIEGHLDMIGYRS